MLKLANNNIRPLCQVARQIVKTGTNEIDGCGEHANQSKKVLGRAHYISRCQLFQRWCSFEVVEAGTSAKKKKKKRESKTFTLKKASTTRLNYPSTYRAYQSSAAIRSPVLQIKKHKTTPCSRASPPSPSMSGSRLRKTSG